MEERILAAIDLGTENIKLALYNPERNEDNPLLKIESMDLTVHAGMTKNIVSFFESDCVIGRSGGQNWTTIHNVKQHITEKGWTETVPSRENRIMDIVEVTEEEIGKLGVMANGLVDAAEAVMTVPVCFTEMQRRMMMKAASGTNVNVTGIITEPFAGLFAFTDMLEEVGEEPVRVLVYDCGAGTLDCCIFEISKQNGEICIKAEASKGLRFGGTDVTNYLYETYLADDLEKKIEGAIQRKISRLVKTTGEALTEKEEADLHDKFRHMEWNEKYRPAIDHEKCTACSIGRENPDEIHEMIVPGANPINITYSDIERMLDERGVNDRIETILDELVHNAMPDYLDFGTEDDRLTLRRIDRILMIGGASQMPYHEKLLMRFFGIPEEKREQCFILPRENVGIYDAVSMGAATYLWNKDVGRYHIEERPSFEIGAVEPTENGKKYKRLYGMGNWMGETNYDVGMEVTPQADKDGNPVIEAYQLFDNTLCSPWNEVLTNDNQSVAERAVYMGNFVLDASKFAVGNPCHIKVAVGTDGTIHGQVCANGAFREDEVYHTTLKVEV